MEKLFIRDLDDAISISVVLTEELSQVMKGNAALNKVVKIDKSLARSVKALYQDVKELLRKPVSKSCDGCLEFSFVYATRVVIVERAETLLPVCDILP